MTPFAIAARSCSLVAATHLASVLTIRTEAAEFTQTGPSGFTSWMGEALGPTAYNLPAAGGSYALTGTAAYPGNWRVFSMPPRRVPMHLTGADATLTKSVAAVAYTLLVDAGSYAISGATAGIYRGPREVLAFPAIYALSGATISLNVAEKLLPNPGSYALTGSVASLELGKEILAVAGSYAVTGATASFEYGRKILALAGFYALTGTDATLTKGAAIVHRTLLADGSSYG